MFPRRVLFSILNWGLGHATRSIPIINLLLRRGHDIILASDGRAGKLIKKEFPSLHYHELPSYQAIYAKKHFFTQHVRLAVRAANAIKKEQRTTQVLVDKYQIESIISDNRYGTYHQGTCNIFITHQFSIPINPIWRPLINRQLERYISNFQFCWVPDISGPDNLTGDLSNRQMPGVVRFIGPLSRLRKIRVDPFYDLAVVLSGPEPQRSILEHKIIDQLQPLELKAIIIQGRTEMDLDNRSGRIEICSHMQVENLNLIICQSKVIIARSGYSTIMDLLVLRKPAILVPTPGQPEQRYLALRHSHRPEFEVQLQDKLNIAQGYEKLLQVNPEQIRPVVFDENVLKAAIGEAGL